MGRDKDRDTYLIKLFEQFNQVGVTVFIATHDLELVKAMPHRQVVLEGGRLASEYAVS